jgi:hypothetical protein
VAIREGSFAGAAASTDAASAASRARALLESVESDLEKLATDAGRLATRSWVPSRVWCERLAQARSRAIQVVETTKVALSEAGQDDEIEDVAELRALVERAESFAARQASLGGVAQLQHDVLRLEHAANPQFEPLLELKAAARALDLEAAANDPALRMPLEHVLAVVRLEDPEARQDRSFDAYTALKDLAWSKKLLNAAARGDIVFSVTADDAAAPLESAPSATLTREPAVEEPQHEAPLSSSRDPSASIIPPSMPEASRASRRRLARNRLLPLVPVGRGVPTTSLLEAAKLDENDDEAPPTSHEGEEQGPAAIFRSVPTVPQRAPAAPPESSKLEPPPNALDTKMVSTPADMPASDNSEVFAPTLASTEETAAPPKIETPSRPVPAPAPRPVALPGPLASFAQFRATYHVTALGAVKTAPWASTDHVEELSRAFLEELGTDVPHFGRLWLLASAASRMTDTLPTPEMVQALDGLWNGRAYAPLRRDRRPLTQLSSARARIRAVLEALAPDLENPLSQVEVDERMAGLDLEDPQLAACLEALHQIALTGLDPVAYTRELLATTSETNAQDLGKEIVKEREALRDLVHTALNRKLIRLRTEFCRELWVAFLREISPVIAPLFPQPGKNEPDWSVGRYAGILERWKHRYHDKMDRAGAAHEDRGRMDRVANEIFERAARIDILCAKASNASPNRKGGHALSHIEVGVFRNLIDTASRTPRLAAADETMMRSLLVRVLSVMPGKRQAEPQGLALALSTGDLVQAPELLGYLPAIRKESLGKGEAGTALDMSHREEAAAYLVPLSRGPQPGAKEAVLAAVRTPEWRHLAARLADALPESERVEVHARTVSLEDAARAALGAAAAKLSVLKDAASVLVESVAHALSDAELVLDGKGNAANEFLLAEKWLREIDDVIVEELGSLRGTLLAEAKSRGEDFAGAVEPLLGASRFAEALAVVRGGALSGQHRTRQTMFRFDASARYPIPITALQRMETLPLVKRWLDPPHQQFSDYERRLRSDFARELLGPHHDAMGKSQERIDWQTSNIKSYLAGANLNPSYLPQLSAFESVTFVGIGSAAANPKFVSQAAEAAGKLATNALVVFLVPRLTQTKRAELLHELRRLRVRAAVIDDLDLLRLLNPEGRPNSVIGILEIALEQQSWAAMSPFQLIEGQHVHVEMYVGRKDEAEQLAKSARFSRVFSGRKLGKSALLRYVERFYDGQELPSALKLRVIYVSAVGTETAAELVEQILEKVTERLRIPASKAQRPFDRLAATLDTFLTKNPKESLLIVLDEADMFVEADLEEYHKDREKCLSFLMRSRLQEKRDAQGLPRIRFVFTGYRVTNTCEGTWANWGDPLRLLPLPPTDAAELVAGPLARLGIDASEQASAIAHRCGYQPAVILRFGEQLLKRLDDRYPRNARDKMRIAVTAEDVGQTFEAEAVQQEIRTVAKNNFQGNDVGRVVFGALLREFIASGPTAGLDNVEELLANRLRELSGEDLSWLQSEGVTIRDRLRGQLDDLLARQLLDQQRSESGRAHVYLRFPHHLPVLSPLAREDYILEDIRRLRTNAADAQRTETTRGLLPRATLQLLHQTLADTSPGDVVVPVFGAVWSPAEPTRGSALWKVLERGLFDPIGTARAPAPTNAAQGPVIPVTPGELNDVLERLVCSHARALLVGGMDLVRACLDSDIRESKSGDRVMLDLHGPRRLSRASVNWWMIRSRGFNFTESSALDEIMACTGGIPLLVAAIDELLMKKDPHLGGLEVTPNLLRDTIDKFRRERLPQCVKALKSGDSGIKLTARELELLSMTARILAKEAPRNGHKELGPQDLARDLGEYWELHREELPDASPLNRAVALGSADMRGDMLAVSALMLVGLLPSATESTSAVPWENLGPLRTDDPLRWLV